MQIFSAFLLHLSNVGYIMWLYEKKVNAWKGTAQSAPPVKETAHHGLKVRAAGCFVQTTPEWAVMVKP